MNKDDIKVIDSFDDGDTAEIFNDINLDRGQSREDIELGSKSVNVLPQVLPKSTNNLIKNIDDFN